MPEINQKHKKESCSQPIDQFVILEKALESFYNIIYLVNRALQNKAIDTESIEYLNSQLKDLMDITVATEQRYGGLQRQNDLNLEYRLVRRS